MNKRDVRTMDDIEKYYSKCRKIKFKDVEQSSLTDIFLKTTSPHRDSQTTYVRGGHHCHNFRYRSLDDIFKLVKFYYPDMTVKSIMKKLLDYEETVPYGKIRFRYCPNIKKHNFAGTSPYGGIIMSMGNKLFSGQGFSKCTVKYVDLTK